MSRAALVMVVGTGVAAGAAAAPAAEAKGGSLSVRGSKVTSERLCGAVRRAASATSATGLIVTVSRPAKSTRSLVVARCKHGKWRRVKSVRIGTRSRGKALVQLGRLSPGAYRITGRGLRTAYVRITRAAAPAGLPLLDRAKHRAPMVAFCEGPDGRDKKPDSTPLPQDPRELVNDHLERKDTAAFFNASWVPVRDAPGFRPAPVQDPKTCGEFRRRAAAGEKFLYSRQMFQLLGSARAYENLWRVWGLPSRPPDFEQQVIDRYGFNKATFRNPFPKEGEDPVATNGGTGQLPMGLVQGIDDDTGKYNGQITISCASCHDSILGDENDKLGFHPGRGSDSFDAMLFAAELSQADASNGPNPFVALAGGVVPFPFSAGRSLSDAFGLIDVLGALFDMETLDISPGTEIFLNHGSSGQVQTPNWWNRAHRTRMFLQGELSGDNTRVSMALAVAQTGRSGAQTKAMEPDFENVHTFLESLSPPPYPKEVDTKLAEEGAILFHEKDLWADSRNRSIPKAGGNGSCASCHGVYSPRYAADPKYLPTPKLKGIEANITPWETIGTDKARTKLAVDQFRRAWDTSWWGYDDLNPKWTPEGQGRAGTTLERTINDWSPTNTRLEGPNKWMKTPGYEAPPLYGAWASAPYFHNGSVPTIRGVLRPDKRPDIWRRPPSKPSSSGIVQGFDTSFAGYDWKDLGYKYSEIPCDRPDTGPLIPCQPEGNALSLVEGTLARNLASDVWLFNQVPPPINEQDRQRRMIFNTYEYSLGNEGHDFTKVLDDHEVDALLEYLKTL